MPHAQADRHGRAASIVPLLLGLVLMVGACVSDRAPVITASLPRAEFLLSAGDSTYWAQSDGTQLRVRSAPLLLTRVDGALIEVFLTDDASEYVEASFFATQLWARPVSGGDSVRLHTDSTVDRARARWRRRFPAEEELTPDDDAASEEPATVVHESLDLLDVHGPFVSVERRLDADIAGGPPHEHTLARFVLDVRTGARQTVAMLFGEVEGARVEALARRLFGQQLDSIRAAGAQGDDRAAAALPTLASFRFIPTSFAIMNVRGAPAVEFLAVGRGVNGEALTMHVPPQTVAEPSWWGAVRPTLPRWSSDSSRAEWSGQTYRVQARRGGENELAITMSTADSPDSTARGTVVATVEGPLYQLIALDAPALDSASRSALARAFDAATMLDAGAEQATFRVPSPSADPYRRQRPPLSFVLHRP